MKLDRFYSMFSSMMDLNNSILNPYARPFHAIQLSLWATYGLIFRLIWLGYDYVPPETLWFAFYVSGGYIASSLLGFIYWKIKKRAFLSQFLIAAFTSIAFGLIWRFCFNYIDFHYLLNEPPEDLDVLYYVLGGTSSVIHLAAWSTGYLLLAYYFLFKKERERSIMAELHAKEAQIKLLHQQVSPHFLFNVLHSLDTLLIKKDINQSRDMVASLGQYLRSSLSTQPDASVPLVDEIGSVQSYLKIEQMRFGNKLKLDWNLDQNLDQFEVPCLILQPLLENAIKHCIDKSVNGGRIEVRTEKINHQIFISVFNSCYGAIHHSDGSDSLGIGLENIRARLDIYFGSRATLETREGDEGEFTAIITIGDNL